MTRKIISIFPVFVILFASFLASKYPDTLERLAINYGFAYRAKESLTTFSNYSFLCMKEGFISTLLSGLVGVSIIFVFYKTVDIVMKCCINNTCDK